MTDFSLYKDLTVKAKCPDPARIEATLFQLDAKFIGTDVQSDVYFKTAVGKLKLRKGKIENVLIHYHRTEDQNTLQTKVYSCCNDPDEKRVERLFDTRDILGESKKERKIYFLENIKIHLDRTEKNEFYVEIEAIDTEGKYPVAYLQEQCDQMRRALHIHEQDLVIDGYSN
jgi:adenylate cyclase, class 2